MKRSERSVKRSAMTWALSASGKDLGPVLEQPVGRDAGRAMVLVALGDDLEGEVGLCRVHRQHREIVDDQEVGTAVTTECALELTVDLGTGEIVEHAGRGGEDDAPRGLAGAIREGTSEDGRARVPDRGKGRCDAAPACDRMTLPSSTTTDSIAPWVCLTIWATPLLPLPAWVSGDHSTVEPLFSVQVLGAASTRYFVKLSVVPEPSERWTTTMS
jgi:hypothetical protein